MMDEEILYKKAKSLVNKKVKFYRYLYCYIIVNVCLFFINLSEIHGNWTELHQWWFLWVTVLWGVWLIQKYRDFVDTPGQKFKVSEEKIQKEMDKMRK